jgi:hypothetical protein
MGLTGTVLSRAVLLAVLNGAGLAAPSDVTGAAAEAAAIL